MEPDLARITPVKSNFSRKVESDKPFDIASSFGFPKAETQRRLVFVGYKSSLSQTVANRAQFDFLTCCNHFPALALIVVSTLASWAHTRLDIAGNIWAVKQKHNIFVF